METEELRQIAISAAVLALAFAVALEGGFSALLYPQKLLYAFALSFVAVSFSFILHELAHRYTARRFGAYAEYRMWPFGLALALLFSLFGFVFAAPGAVMIHPRADLWGRFAILGRKKLGLVSLAGPAVNIALALLFAAAYFIYPSELAAFGVSVNAWLAFFNLLPVPPLDGFKVFHWSRRLWLAAATVPLAVMIIWAVAP